MLRPFYIFASFLFFNFLFLHCGSSGHAEQTKEQKHEGVVSPNPIEKQSTEAVAVEVKNDTQTLAPVASKDIPAKSEKPAPKVKETSVKDDSPKKESGKTAKIKFEETTYQFGTIKQGDKINHDFVFKNTGDVPLVIKKVEVSCGCTFPSYPFIPIEPGAEGKIEVTFNSEHKVGRQKPTITVITNASPRTYKLYLEGMVE